MKRHYYKIAIVAVCMAILSPLQAGGDYMAGVNKLYVVDVTGSISKTMGQSMASMMSASLLHALSSHHVEVFTWLNLKQQLNVEQKKEVLRCNEKQGCIEEIISGFGIAVKLYSNINRLSKGKYVISLTLMRHARPLNKLVRRVNVNKAGDLLDVMAGLALEVVGVARPVRQAGGPAFHFESLSKVPLVREVGKLDARSSGLDFRNANVAELEAYDKVVRFDKGSAPPEKKVSAWQEFGKKWPKFAVLATRRAGEWKARLAFERRRDEDWSKLSKLMKLSVIPQKDKVKWAKQFIKAYGRDTKNNPYIEQLRHFLAPDWFNDPIKGCTAGYAKIRAMMSFARDQAIKDARKGLISTLNGVVLNLLKRYSAGDYPKDTIIRRIVRTILDKTIASFRVVRTELRDNRYYALVCLDPEAFANAFDRVNELSGKERRDLKAIVKAEFKDMDRHLEKLRKVE